MISDLNSVDIHRPGPIRMDSLESNFLRLFVNLKIALANATGTAGFEILVEEILDLCKCHLCEMKVPLSIGVRKSIFYALRLTLASQTAANRELTTRFIKEIESSIISDTQKLKENFPANNFSSATIAKLLKEYSKRNEFEFGYDEADHYFDAALSYEPPNFNFDQVGVDGLWFQPTPISLLVRWFAEEPPTNLDLIYDFGAGTGRTAIAMALLSNAQIRGIEIDNRLCQIANSLIEDNQIPRCAVIKEDIRSANFSDGTIFYIFNSFKGELLEYVLVRLESIARERTIVVAAMGDCREYLNKCSWLKQTTAENECFMTIGRYRSTIL